MEGIVTFLFNVILYPTLYSAVKKKKDNTSVYQHIKSPHLIFLFEFWIYINLPFVPQLTSLLLSNWYW